MTHKTRAFASALLLTAVTLFAAAPKAEAGSITLTDGITSVTVFDNGAGDTNGAAGLISFNASFGAWIISVATGLTMPAQGSALSPSMNLIVTAVSAGSAGPLTASFNQGGFGPSSVFGQASLSLNATSPGTASYNVSQNAGPTLVSPLVGQSLPFILTTGAAVYSLTQQVTLTHASAGTSTVQANLTVPDGGLTLSMLGSGLLALGLLRRRFGL